MPDEKDAVSFQEDAPSSDDSRAEWRPYSVWRENIHANQDREDEASQQNIELTGSWKPLAVWQRQI